MRLSDRFGDLAGRGAIVCAAAAIVAAASGCGFVLNAGSTAYSGAEALASVVKQAADGGGGDGAETGDGAE